MSLRCKIFGHKWKSGIVTEIPNGLQNTSGFRRNSRLWPMDVRMCWRCYYKQLNHGGDWQSFKLTKEELRDKNLKELGI